MTSWYGVCHEFLQISVHKVQSSQAHFWKPPSFFLAVTRARSKWPPDTECVTIFYKRSVQWGTILTSALLKTTEFFSLQLLVRVVKDLLIRSVSRFSTKDQFNKVQSSQAHSWKPTSFSLAATRARSKRPPNMDCFTIFYKRSVHWGKILTSAHLKTTEFFLGSWLVRVVNDLLIWSVSW